MLAAHETRHVSDSQPPASSAGAMLCPVQTKRVASFNLVSKGGSAGDAHLVVVPFCVPSSIASEPMPLIPAPPHFFEALQKTRLESENPWVISQRSLDDIYIYSMKLQGSPPCPAPEEPGNAKYREFAPPSAPWRMPAPFALRWHAAVRCKPVKSYSLRSSSLFAQVRWKQSAFLRRPQTKGLRSSVLCLRLLRTGRHFARQSRALRSPGSSPPRFLRPSTRSSTVLFCRRMARRTPAPPHQPDYQGTIRHPHSRLKTSLLVRPFLVSRFI